MTELDVRYDFVNDKIIVVEPPLDAGIDARIHADERLRADRWLVWDVFDCLARPSFARWREARPTVCTESSTINSAETTDPNTTPC